MIRGDSSLLCSTQVRASVELAMWRAECDAAQRCSRLSKGSAKPRSTSLAKGKPAVLAAGAEAGWMERAMDEGRCLGVHPRCSEAGEDVGCV